VPARWLLPALAIAALTACGGDGGSGNPDGGGAGGTGGGGANACIPATTSCTAADQAAVNQYVGCLETACATEYMACYGAGYKSGNYGGPCGTYAQCYAACGCNPPSSCTSACGAATQDCTACLSTLGACVAPAACSRPACYDTTP
jgi:hypothetical protein